MPASDSHLEEREKYRNYSKTLWLLHWNILASKPVESNATLVVVFDTVDLVGIIAGFYRNRSDDHLVGSSIFATAVPTTLEVLRSSTAAVVRGGVGEVWRCCCMAIV